MNTNPVPHEDDYTLDGFAADDSVFVYLGLFLALLAGAAVLIARLS